MLQHYLLAADIHNDNVSAWKKNDLLVPHGANYIKVND